MTTIVFDGLTFCSDSQVTRDHIIVGDNYTKVFKFRREDGAIVIVGAAGSAADCDQFKRWVESDYSPSEAHWEAEEVSGLIVVDKNGELEVLEYSGTSLPFRAQVPCAVGSGGDLALAAMLAGADAKKAVKVASQLDVFTNDKIKGFKKGKKGWTQIS